jgi:tRNA A-37 threonylcarbamoyl transferase component Bud32
MFCSCGTPAIDEKYAANLVKKTLSIPDNVTAEKLTGGFSGAPLFVATTETKKYVVRFLKHKPLEERKREIGVLQIASQAEYGPHVYFADADQGVVIMEFLSPQAMPPELWQSEKLYVMLAKFLQKIHRGPKFENIEALY